MFLEFSNTKISNDHNLSFKLLHYFYPLFLMLAFQVIYYINTPYNMTQTLTILNY